MDSENQSENRQVFCEDAVAWLEKSPVQANCSFVASLPDISEFPSFSLTEWKNWFEETASLILSRTPDDGVAIFYQSDIKLDGEWVDKGFLCQRAAEKEGSKLLWHKIACRVPAGQASFGRCGYSHILCFSRTLKIDLASSTADVMPEIGEKLWPRGIGFESAMMIAEFVATRTTNRTIVNPFCGHGSMLAAANRVGLSAIGIERSTKRARASQEVDIQLSGKRWGDRGAKIS